MADDQPEDDPNSDPSTSGPLGRATAWITQADDLAQAVRRLLVSLGSVLTALAALILIGQGVFGGNDNGSESSNPLPEIEQEEETTDTTQAEPPVKDQEEDDDCFEQIKQLIELSGGTVKRIALRDDCQYEVGDAGASATFPTEDAAVSAAAALADAGFDDLVLDFEVEQPIQLADIGQVRFDVNSAELSAGAREELNKLTLYLEANATGLAIHGHTDSSGLSDHNLALSQRRADAALAYLVEAGAVEADRVSGIGFGETRPIATNTTQTGRSDNRRIDFVFGAATNHTITPADTLWVIAQAQYGDATRWPEIYLANQKQIDDPDALAIGTVIVIPPSG